MEIKILIDRDAETERARQRDRGRNAYRESQTKRGGDTKIEL